MKAATVRLQKYMSQRGVASRRACAAIIAARRVRVNGEVSTEPGMRIDPVLDEVTVDARLVPHEIAARRCIMLYKPRGVVCSRNAGQGRTIYALLPRELQTLVPVGRLDKESEGLLLLSNSGELVNRLTHPRFGQRKSYSVTVCGGISSAVLKKLRSRMLIDGYRIQPVEVALLGEVQAGAEGDGAAAHRTRRRHVLQFVLSEGRNRQIRKMCSAAGLRVQRLERTAVHNLRSDGLHPGQWRDLTELEIAELDSGAA